MNSLNVTCTQINYIYDFEFQQVLEFLSNPDDESRHEERQQALMELLRAGGLIQIDEERLLYLVENAKL